jgi:hypothetical protein
MANPTKAVVAPAVVEEKKLPKMPKKMADQLLKEGILTAEKYAEMQKKGMMTSGEGGGEDIFDQLTAGGVSAELIEKVKKALADVNAVLWKDAKTYIGKNPKHKFSFTHEDVDYSYEAPAEIEFAAWVKHFDPKQKENRTAALAKAGIVIVAKK